MSALLHSRPEVVVPKIEGKSLLEALQMASALNLSIQQESVDFDESLPAGTIIRQHPPSGMQVRSGRAIRVIVSKGGQVVFIPDIVGRPIAEAQSMLAGDGIQMGAVNEIYSNDVAKGTVITQTPSSGTVATRGAMVDVSVSKGMPPLGLPLLPDFIGQASSSVQEWASGVGAQVKMKENAKAVGPAGTVVKQDPEPGQPLMEGHDIHITVVPLASSQSARFTYVVPASGPDEVTVRIMARDNTGESKVYEGKHRGGTKVEIPIGITVTTRFRVYVDDLLKEERVVEP
jgi:serine/threonine-protein kinase